MVYSVLDPQSTQSHAAPVVVFCGVPHDAVQQDSLWDWAVYRDKVRLAGHLSPTVHLGPPSVSFFCTVRYSRVGKCLILHCSSQ